MKESLGDFENIMQQFDKKIKDELPQLSIPEQHQSSEPEEDFALLNVLWQSSANAKETHLPWAVISFDAVVAWGMVPPTNRIPKYPIRK